jgi:hypothetical protein
MLQQQAQIADDDDLLDEVDENDLKYMEKISNKYQEFKRRKLERG